MYVVDDGQSGFVYCNPSAWSAAERLDVERRRERLEHQIDAFHAKAAQFWGAGEDDCWQDISGHESPELISSDSEDDKDDNFFFAPQVVESHDGAESCPLRLPSSIGVEACRRNGHGCFAEQEYTLRVGHANDSLQALRLALSRKAVIFREGMRKSKSKVQKTRSWDQIISIDGSVRHQAKLYNKARAAMIRLGASPQDLIRYKVLQRDHLSITTARIDPSLRGQRNSSLAWFWTMDVRADTDASEGMSECTWRLLTIIFIVRNSVIWPVYRVHWLKAKARRDRWQEEHVLVLSEMKWTVLFYQNKASVWKGRADKYQAGGPSSSLAMPVGQDMTSAGMASGRQCYAYKQANMWSKLAEHADERFHIATIASQHI